MGLRLLLLCLQKDVFNASRSQAQDIIEISYLDLFFFFDNLANDFLKMFLRSLGEMSLRRPEKISLRSLAKMSSRCV